MTDEGSKSKRVATAAPNVFIGNLLRFLGALGGGAFFTHFAPPIEPFALVSVAVIAIAAVAWLVGFVLSQKWDLRRALKAHFKRLLIFATAAIFLLIVISVLYVNLWDTYTVPYSGTRVFIGSELTIQGKQYFTKNPNASPEEAVWDAAGKSDDVWTAASIRNREIKLWALFLVLVFFIVFPITLTAYSLGGSNSRSRSSEEKETR
jgi:hypothetical protein